MNLLKKFILAVTIASMNTILYPTFNDITKRFSSSYEGKVSIMPINGDSGEKIVFTYSDNCYSRIPPKISIFHLNSNNIVIKRTKGKEGTFYISTNKDSTHPLALFKYTSDMGYATWQQSRILTWGGNKLIKISNTWDVIDKCFFGNHSFYRLICLTGLGTSNEKAFLLNQRNELISTVFTERLKNVELIASDNQFIFIVYQRRKHPNKKHKHKYKCPALLKINSDNQLIDISDEFSELKKLNRLLSAHLINSENKLFIYGITLDNEAVFFLLDSDIKQVVEFTGSCGLEANNLENIESINFSHNLPPSQLVCLIYKNSQAKLFWFHEGVFTDITDTCGIDKAFLDNVASVNLIQDNFGTTISINRFKKNNPLNIQKYFHVFHDPEMICGYSDVKKIKNAASSTAVII